MFDDYKSQILSLLSVILILVHAALFASDGAYESNSATRSGEDEWQLHSVVDGHWIVNAKDTGTDIPKEGRSLFDILFSVDQADALNVQIPFPFTQLIEKIKTHLTVSDDAIKQVRIPVGRSLRRNAVAPDFFDRPRVVVAADAEPRIIQGKAGLNLKGRLFLGYQQQSNIVEVISYNPVAGRFEFQEIIDYGEGLKPKVRYANRRLCLSCHQNAGPIFSKEPWLETDSNQKVKARLTPQATPLKVKAKYLPRFDHAWALDYATDRANYFASSQFIWRQGCAVTNEHKIIDSFRCRSAMLLAIIQFRLLGYVDNNLAAFQNWLQPVIERNWREKWPGGLLIATADIPDKDPFASISLPNQDPLNPRQPRAKWTKPSSRLLTGIVYQTADFLTEPDVYLIDQYLQNQASKNQTPHQYYESSCRLLRSADIGSGQYIKFSCDTVQASSATQFTARGSFVFDGNRITQGNLDTLKMPDQINELRFLDFGETEVYKDGGFYKATIPIRKHKTRLGARMFDGRLLKQIEIQWPVNLQKFKETTNQSTRLSTVDDFKPLYKAINKMVVDNLHGNNDALSSKPFRRHTIVKTLHRNLGMDELVWDQYHSDYKNIVADEKPVTATVTSLLPLYQHCSACHLNKGDYPPGFLNGARAQVEQKVRQCGQKILARLNLWNHKPSQRLISPMPPFSWITAVGMNEDEWLNSKEVEKMQKIVMDLMSNDSANSSRLSNSVSLCL